MVLKYFLRFQNNPQKILQKNFMNEKILKNLDKLPADVRRQFSLLMNQYGEKKKQTSIQNDFLTFVKHVWPEFIEGSHHKKIASKFNDLSKGKIKRLIINSIRDKIILIELINILLSTLFLSANNVTIELCNGPLIPPKRTKKNPGII